MAASSAFLRLAFLTFSLTTEAKMLRNNALMSKMITHFQRDHNMESQNMHTLNSPKHKSDHIVSLMQSVLCRNFPTIPCDVIVHDNALRSLIERSIRQISAKKMNLGSKTTANPLSYDLTLFPIASTDDYSHEQASKERSKSKMKIQTWSLEKEENTKKKVRKDVNAALYAQRKKIRKFYPHKTKYKDKTSGTRKDTFGDFSAEKISMSVEIPETKRRSNEPVWRIDYMKHGDPSINAMNWNQGKELQTKIMQQPNLLLDNRMMKHRRRDVKHSDVYIKNTFVRKPLTTQQDND